MEEVAHKKYLNDYFTGKIWGVDSRGELYNDDPRLGDARLCGTTASLCGIEAAVYERNEWKVDRGITLDIMLHAFLYTQSGIPVLYSGDEIGQLNDYTYHENPLRWDDSRYLHRGDLNWDDVEKRKQEGTIQERICTALQKLRTIRSSHPVFDSDADTWIVEPYNDHILGIGRYYKGEKLIALFNFSEEDQTAWVNESETYYDLMTGLERPAIAVGIPANSFAWLLTDFNEAPSEKVVVKTTVEEAAGLKADEAKEEEPAKKEAAKPKARKPRAKKAKAKVEEVKAEVKEKVGKAKADAKEKVKEAKAEAKAATEEAEAKAATEEAPEAEAKPKKKTTRRKTTKKE
jgi:amylosucrase